MAQRVGVVLVFKAGTTKQEALDALAQIAEVVDTGDPRRPPRVQEYDDRTGGPVWYIP